ncbi:amidohydrolase family protein [Candidatus Sumerlaeota bacterium]|nr:amidohydrolase family protein [Candidatus Sumerlaeota bacterium]
MADSPSYLNAHCHLELSLLKGAIRPGLPFVEWLEKIVALKRAAKPDDLLVAARAAMQRLHETGTRVLWDIDSLGIVPHMVQQAETTPLPLQSLTIFRELIRFDPVDAAAIVEVSAKYLPDPCDVVNTEVEYGLSPHAPYTTSRALLQSVAGIAIGRRFPVCIHAAETAEENEMLEKGTGPLRDFLNPFLPKDWKAPGKRTMEYLDDCRCLNERTLLVHCNDVTDDEIALIAKRGASVVVCPGTHVYFGRGEFPLARLMSAGVNVLLGTDSLASNEDLDMAREIRLARELAPSVPIGSIEKLAVIGQAAPGNSDGN